MIQHRHAGVYRAIIFPLLTAYEELGRTKIQTEETCHTSVFKTSSCGRVRFVLFPAQSRSGSYPLFPKKLRSSHFRIRLSTRSREFFVTNRFTFTLGA
jgi:hypothetical protein